MAYEIPKVTTGVYFTKDLSEVNRKNGEWLLGYYFRESKISKPPYFPISNFSGMIDFLNYKYPTYIESLGELLKIVESDKLIASMKDAAKKGYTDYPRPAYFSSSIMANTGKSISSVLGEVASEVGNDIISIASGFSKLVLIVAIIGVSVFVFSKTGGTLAGAKRLLKIK